MIALTALTIGLLCGYFVGRWRSRDRFIASPTIDAANLYRATARHRGERN